MLGVQQIGRVILEMRAQRLAERLDERLVLALRQQPRGAGVEVMHGEAGFDLDFVRLRGIASARDQAHAVPEVRKLGGLRKHHDVHAAGVLRAWFVEG